MDNEMINRVIKASFDCWNERRGLSYTVEDLSAEEREFAELHALAIIKAMHEPTERMLAFRIMSDAEKESVKDDYQAMIDSITNDR